MKASKLIPAALLIALCAVTSNGGEEVDRLLEGYGKIETVTCQIRRTKEGELGKMKFLSRVYFTNKNQLHAEKLVPVQQRTIADGKMLYQYAEGDPKGFSRPIDELSEQMKISLFMVPGTAMDHLLRLKDCEEEDLPPLDGQKRIGIEADGKYVVLLIDEMGRLAGLEYYSAGDLAEKTASYSYSKFTEAVPGVWVPLHHLVESTMGDKAFKETVVVDRYIANKPVAASLFIPSSFFDKNIDFVDDFQKIYPE